MRPWTSDTPIWPTTALSWAEARVVAAELGLPSWWLNEQATVYLPPGPDLEASAVLDRPGLTVVAASPRHLLAMKVAPRANVTSPNILVLSRLVGASSAEEVSCIAVEVFGTSPSATEAELCSPISTRRSTSLTYLLRTGRALARHLLALVDEWLATLTPLLR